MQNFAYIKARTRNRFSLLIGKIFNHRDKMWPFLDKFIAQWLQKKVLNMARSVASDFIKV